MKHRIKVTEIYRNECVVYIEVDAEDAEDALELVQSGTHELPPFDDKIWTDSWDCIETKQEIVR